MQALAVSDFASWRKHARQLLAGNVDPASVIWANEDQGEQSLFSEETQSVASDAAPSVPVAFLDLAKVVSLHRDPAKWPLLYRVLYRLTLAAERDLLKIEIDPDIRRLYLMRKAVTRDMHKMKAFVRFRRIEGTNPEEFAAWHRPDHLIVEAMAPWFRDRFGEMRWSILTPDKSVRWDGTALAFSDGVSQSDAPQGDSLEELWRSYYAAIFNPARVKIGAMKKEMPVRHWATLPEATIISQLLLNAEERVSQMAKAQITSATPFVPRSGQVDELRVAARRCEGCDLFHHASQVVFGEGPPKAKVVMIGEQPGDEEDLKGKPFVGPAGRLLNKALEEVGFDREQVYVTNAVKHFKFVERGKRRIHAKPTGIEISACRPWLEAELLAIQPELIVCLGATAAQSLMGREFRVTSERGIFFPHRWAKELMATIHPSALLRMPDPQLRDEEYARFLHDLTLVRDRMKAAA